MEKQLNRKQEFITKCLYHCLKTNFEMEIYGTKLKYFPKNYFAYTPIERSIAEYINEFNLADKNTYRNDITLNDGSNYVLTIKDNNIVVIYDDEGYSYAYGIYSEQLGYIFDNLAQTKNKLKEIITSD